MATPWIHFIPNISSCTSVKRVCAASEPEMALFARLSARLYRILQLSLRNFSDKIPLCVLGRPGCPYWAFRVGQNRRRDVRRQGQSRGPSSAPASPNRHTYAASSFRSLVLCSVRCVTSEKRRMTGSAAVSAQRVEGVRRTTVRYSWLARGDAPVSGGTEQSVLGKVHSSYPTNRFLTRRTVAAAKRVQPRTSLPVTLALHATVTANKP